MLKDQVDIRFNAVCDYCTGVHVYPLSKSNANHSIKVVLTKLLTEFASVPCCIWKGLITPSPFNSLLLYSMLLLVYMQKVVLILSSTFP